MRIRSEFLLTICLFVLAAPQLATSAPDFELRKGEHISYIGNTLADRMQHHAWLETYIHALFPKHELVVRNLGFSADEVTTRTRSDNFGSPDQWLAKNETDVVFGFFGYNEALRGADGLAGFRSNLAKMIDGMRSQKYNGKSAPRIVLFSPIAHENLKSRHLPDGKENNEKLALYTKAMAEVCEEKDVRFVDLFAATKQLYAGVSKARASKSLTLNGVHLLDHGNQALAKHIAKALFARAAEVTGNDAALAKLREAILDKNYHWFSRYRVVDGYNVFGGRSRLTWFGQSNADVMMREMEMFDVMTANRDVAVWAAAQGRTHKVVDKNLPPALKVRTNKPGKLEGERHPYLGGKEAISRMTIAEGMEVNLFASEEEFPEIANPVQMAVDTNGRLFVSVWPSYPHWNPREPRLDRIVCLPDDDGNGEADRCIIFADELNSITGFEFWGGGMLVAAPPEIWYLEDTDGDYVADKKIRMLQGVSSADTHHSANAMVLGPDGWLYWSRGIFNVAPMETPTRTYRSGASGVHRFNPRTFEVEFQFPIGPNPHGDVFDQWGYQFVNDGTGGTGSYVNIGKGRGNRQWFRKRVRPVAATGILSSSHFPERNQGNFLICNTIGVRAVLQHEVKYDGADIRAEEIEPIVQSSDPNFRPTDVEIGGDGALYISDWCNVLIGHMQHNMRDPNRDLTHGRIYRVTAKGRKLLKPMRLKGKPIPEVLRALFAPESPNRYRARLELSGRKTEDIVREVGAFAAKLDPKKPVEAQALLESLWVFEEHRVPNLELAKKVFQADEARVRAAAIRTLGHWGPGVFKTRTVSGEPGWLTKGWESLLVAGSRDESMLVRAEAVKAAVEYEGATSAEIIFEVATRKTDSEIEACLNYARQSINVDAMVTDAVKKGRKLSPAAQAYALQKASAESLLAMPRTDAVFSALLDRKGMPPRARQEALVAFAKKNGRSVTAELLAQIDRSEVEGGANLDDLATILATSPKAELKKSSHAISLLAGGAQSNSVRSAAYAAWIRAGGALQAWAQASRKSETLADLLNGLRHVDKKAEGASLYASIRPLQFELPKHLQPKEGGDNVVRRGPAIQFDYYEPHPRSAKNEAFDRAKPKFSGKLANFQKHVPKGKTDQFGIRQRAGIYVRKSGTYTFYTNSDDGSCLYIDGQLVVDNDGSHGPVERSGNVQLRSGVHEIVVNYYDSGGGDHLAVSWKGPGFGKQRIPTSSLRAAGGGGLQELALAAIIKWPGKTEDKVDDFAKLASSEKLAVPALDALAALPVQKTVKQLSADRSITVIDALIKSAGEASPAERQTDEFLSLLDLGDGLLGKVSSNREIVATQLGALRRSIPVKADPHVMELGKEVYHRESHCATCHQPYGQGLPNLYPPLDGSIWVTGSEERLIHIVLDGLHGKIEVNGKTWSSPPLPPMTGFRHLLNDKEIAAVVTYVRNTWSNRAKPVTTKQVSGIRSQATGDETFWNAADLVAKFPLEDGSVAVAATKDGWVPKFVKSWKVTDFRAADLAASGRSHAAGKLAFERLGCAQCHKLQGQGGLFGPDLATLDKKKSEPKHLLESLIAPSRVVDEKFSLNTVILNTGAVVSGIVTKETAAELHLVADPLAGSRPRVVKKSTMIQRTKTASSIMPEGLVNSLQKNEILDLVAYVLARGEKSHKVFQSK